MKILTNKEYEELVNVVEQNEEIESWKKKVEQLHKDATETIYDFERQMAYLKEDHQRDKDQWEYQTTVKVAEAMKAQSDEVAKLKLDLGNAEKEVEILNRAFENLGFDVKDMKEILNKLVDGVVAKNQIQLVK